MTTRFPEWIRRGWASGEEFRGTRDLLEGLGVHTVCQSARCPNIGECWRHRAATLMVLGDVCTRNCAFCSVRSGTPKAVDPEEPARVAEAIAQLGLSHAVITSVTRDDLPDGGAAHIALTVEAIRRRNAGATVEVLVPDFDGRHEFVDRVLASRPDVFGHNVETVERLHPVLRDARYGYRRSLGVLSWASRSTAAVKSALMVGHGETPEEVRQTLEDLLEAGCVAVCIGQYLRPARTQCDVVEFVTPETFEAYERLARGMGFTFAVSAPFARSSYRSDELIEVLQGRTRTSATM